eukprot:1195329-Prorocentrum_minimum.AAC.2
MVCGMRERRATVAVLEVHRRSCLQQRPHSLLQLSAEFRIRTVFAYSLVQGHHAFAVLEVHRRSCFQQLAR